VKIAIIGHRGVPARYGGFETCAEQVGRRLAARGHDVTAYGRARYYPERPREFAGMRLRMLPSMPGKHVETLSHTAVAAWGARRHDAIICMGVGNAPIVRLLEAAHHRTVFNVDGADWQRAKWSAPAAGYLRACEGMAARGSSTLVADAQCVAAYYRAHFGRATEVIPYGAEPPADRGVDVLRRFGLEPGRYVMFAGRLVPENSVHDYLDGARVAALGIPTVVVGDATYASAYIRELRARAQEGTVFTGYQFGAAYQQLSAHAAIFVLGARVGGTHPALLEQMAAGNCVLAVDTESNREVLGDAGLYWSHPDDLARALVRCWRDEALRAELGAAARARQVARYDWDAVTSRYEDLCQEIAAQK